MLYPKYSIHVKSPQILCTIRVAYATKKGSLFFKYSNRDTVRFFHASYYFFPCMITIRGKLVSLTCFHKNLNDYFIFFWCGNIVSGAEMIPVWSRAHLLFVSRRANRLYTASSKIQGTDTRFLMHNKIKVDFLRLNSIRLNEIAAI